MRTLRIGLLGLGTVGSGVVKLIRANGAIIEQKTGTRLSVDKVLVRDPSKGRDPELGDLPITTDPSQVVANPDIDLVVEVMGGMGAARDYMKRALQAGQWVVTANKDCMAEYGGELDAAAKAGNAGLLFEASVGGGIPIIRALGESLAGNRIQSVMGIVNGTTNYILSKMTLEGVDYGDVLAEAQRLGFAEADPTADVGGHDAARKLSILCTLSFLSEVKPANVYTEGITGITARDIQVGANFGWVVKLLAIGKETDGGIEARVHPTFIPRSHPLAAVNGSLNAIFVRGDAVGETMFYGRGAGSLPTASAVVGDIIYAAMAKAGNANPMGRPVLDKKPLRDIGAVVCRYYVRLSVKDQPGVLAKVARVFGDSGVSIESVMQTTRGERTPATQAPAGRENEPMAELVFVTHEVAEGNLQTSLRVLRSLSEVGAVESLIRVEA